MRGAQAVLRVCSRSFLFAVLAASLVMVAFSQQSTSPAPAPASQQKPDSSQNPANPVQPAEKHSTPEDRQRLVAVARKLEAAPLDPALGPDRAWAVQWIVAAPDVHVTICNNLLADLRRPKYKYRSELTNQLLISSAAYLIEHPEQGTSTAEQNVAGMAAVLRTYSAILKTDPQATAKSLDDFLQKQKEGKLDETVREMAKSCK